MKYGRDILSKIPKTVHGGQAWRTEGIEDYSHNLNPFGPPDDIEEIIAGAIADIGHYPDDSCQELKEALSRTFSVNENNIIIGAGSSEIIRNFPNAFMDIGDKVLMNRPSFAEYAQQCRVTGLDILYNELCEENDFRIDATSFLDNAYGVKAVYICNPNNPTGRVEPRDKIIEIVKACRDMGVLVFLDETLLELVPDHEMISCATCVDRYENLIVAGSLTKSFAIPGIRIGYGFASQPLIEEMDKVRMTWNVGQVEQTVAKVLVSEKMDYVYKAAAMMAEESVHMRTELNAIGFPIGNVADSFFYFCSLKGLNLKGSEFQKRMLKENIMIRDCASFGDRFDDFVRFSVKDRERNDTFVKAVERSIR